MSYLQRLVDRAIRPTSAVGNGAAPLFPPLATSAPAHGPQPPHAPAAPSQEATLLGDLRATPKTDGPARGQSNRSAERLSEPNAADHAAHVTPAKPAGSAKPVEEHARRDANALRDRPPSSQESIGPEPSLISPPHSPLSRLADFDEDSSLQPSGVSTASPAPPTSTSDSDVESQSLVEVAAIARPAQNDPPSAKSPTPPATAEAVPGQSNRIGDEIPSSSPIDVYIDTIEIVSSAGAAEVARPAAASTSGFADYAALRMYDWGD